MGMNLCLGLQKILPGNAGHLTKHSSWMSSMRWGPLGGSPPIPEDALQQPPLSRIQHTKEAGCLVAPKRFQSFVSLELPSPLTSDLGSYCQTTFCLPKVPVFPSPCPEASWTLLLGGSISRLQIRKPGFRRVRSLRRRFLSVTGSGIQTWNCEEAPPEALRTCGQAARPHFPPVGASRAPRRTHLNSSADTC